MAIWTPPVPFSDDEIATIVAMLATARTWGEIGRAVGRSAPAVARKARPLVAAMTAAGELPPCGCGKLKFHSTPGLKCNAYDRPLAGSAESRARHAGANAYTTEQMATLIAMLSTANTIAKIAETIGRSQSHVRDIASPLVARMVADGTLGPCACGKHKFHAGLCASRKRPHPHPERLVQVRDMLANGFSCAEIGRRLGVSSTYAYKHIPALTRGQAERRASVIQRHIAERRRNSPVRKPRRFFTTKDHRALRALMFRHDSLRQIATEMNRSHALVTRYAAPKIRALRATSQLPPCGCGLDRFHIGSCRARTGILSEEGRQRLRSSRHAGPRDPDRVRAIVTAIMQGRSIGQTAAGLHMTPWALQYYYRYLTPPQKADLKLKRSGYRPAMTIRWEPKSDPLWKAIDQALPRWTEPSARDDIISDVYVWALSNEVGPAAIETAIIMPFVRAEHRGGVGVYGHASLNEVIADQSETTFLDRLEDPSALEAFDKIFADEDEPEW